MDAPSADQGRPWWTLPENRRDDTPPWHWDSTMASSPPYESPMSSQEEVPSPPVEQPDTANERPPRLPFWNQSLESTYNAIPQPVRPTTGWTAYEGTAIKEGFVRGIKPVNAVQTHLPLRSLMTEVDRSKCFSGDDLARGTTYIYSRTIPVILSKDQKKTLSGGGFPELAKYLITRLIR